MRTVWLLFCGLSACSKPATKQEQLPKQESMPTESPEQVQAREKAARQQAWQTRAAGLVSVTDRESAIIDCATDSACNARDQIALGAPSPKEQARLSTLYFTTAVQHDAATAVDGTDISREAVRGVAWSLKKGGPIVLETLAKTTPAEAKKDPERARGKVLRASGRVVSIERDGEYYRGTFAAGGSRYIYFVTPFSTEGVVDGTWADFMGVFLQEYAYANVSGGQTRSLLVVGSFGRNRPNF